MFGVQRPTLQDSAKGSGEFSMIPLLLVKSSVVSLLLLPQRPERQSYYFVSDFLNISCLAASSLHKYIFMVENLNIYNVCCENCTYLTTCNLSAISRILLYLGFCGTA